MAILRLFCVWFICLGMGSKVPAQEKSVTFRKFTQDDGLGLKYHYCTAQDRDGFIWLGTGDGLYRYDGHGFKRYHSPLDKDRRSISSILVSVVYDSVYNRLWLASITDLQYFDLNDYTFHSWLDASLKLLEEKSFYKRIFKVDDHTLWLSSGRHFIRYHIKSKKFTILSENWVLPPSCDTRVLKFFPYDEKNILLMYPNCLLIVDKMTLKYRTIMAAPDEFYMFAYYDPDLGKIFITAMDYLLVYDTQTGKRRRYSHVYRTKTNKELKRIFSVFCNFDERYIFIPGASESMLFDKMTENFAPFLSSENNNHLGVNPINIFKDREDNIWINTFDNNSIVVYRPNKDLVSTGYIQNRDGINVEPYRTVRYNKQTYLVSGSGFSGLMTLDPVTGKVKIINNPRQTHPKINACLVLDDGRIYNADKDHINRIDLKTEKFYPQYFEIDGYRQSVSNIKQLTKAGNKRVVAVADDSLFILDFNRLLGKKMALRDLHTDDDGISGDNFIAHGIIDNKFYCYSDAGVFVLDLDRFMLSKVDFPTAYNSGNTIVSVSGLDVDEEGNFWISSELNGLFRYDRKNSKLYHFFADNSKIRTNHVNKVICLPQNKIWIASGDVVYLYDNRASDWLYEYSPKTGIPGYAYGNFYFEQDQKMVLNYYPYILILSLPSEPGRSRLQSPKFTSLLIGGREKLNHPTEEDLSFVLGPDENDIELSFTYLNLTYSFNNRYRYKMEGLDTAWTVVNSNVATYKRMPTGNYNFLLQASDANGVWSHQIRKMHFKVTPVFYQTAWFQTAIVLFFGLLGYLYYRYRIDKVRLSESLKRAYEKELSKLELKALRAQMNPHFIFNSLNSIQKFIFNKDEYSASQYLTKFSRLIRYILEHSNQDYVSIREEVEMLNYYLELEQLRFDQQFEFTFIYENNLDEGWLIPSMVVQPHVENAIWHGLMHKEDKGKLVITFRKIDDHKFMIAIEDNGVGREKAKRLKSKQLYKKKSFGSSLSEQKLSSLAHLHNLDYKITILDLTDKNDKALGTRVEMILPVITPEKIQVPKSDNINQTMLKPQPDKP